MNATVQTTPDGRVIDFPYYASRLICLTSIILGIAESLPPITLTTRRPLRSPTPTGAFLLYYVKSDNLRPLQMYTTNMFVFPGVPINRELTNLIAPLVLHPEFEKRLRSTRMELHITLKAPQDIADEARSEWVMAAKQAMAGARMAKFTITGLGFITTSTLALYIDPRPLLPLHNGLVTALKPYSDSASALHEGEQYQPHITIGRATRGPLDALQRRQVLEELRPMAPPTGTFKATIVRLYGRDEGVYRPLLDISLEN